MYVSVHSPSRHVQSDRVGLEYLLDICVVVWRAWVLHAENRWVRVALAACIPFAVCIIVEFVNSALEMIHAPQGETTLIWAVPLLLTSIFATSLVAVRAWQPGGYCLACISSALGASPPFRLGLLQPWLNPLQGIYPTVVILVVAMRR
ncbi:hypothetical protein K525DRAFT_215011, partial [Schizophyllum commune Loenen D]